MIIDNRLFCFYIDRFSRMLPKKRSWTHSAVSKFLKKVKKRGSIKNVKHLFWNEKLIQSQNERCKNLISSYLVVKWLGLLKFNFWCHPMNNTFNIFSFNIFLNSKKIFKLLSWKIPLNLKRSSFGHILDHRTLTLQPLQSTSFLSSLISPQLLSLSLSLSLPIWYL